MPQVQLFFGKSKMVQMPTVNKIAEHKLAQASTYNKIIRVEMNLAPSQLTVKYAQ